MKTITAIKGILTLPVLAYGGLIIFCMSFLYFSNETYWRRTGLVISIIGFPFWGVETWHLLTLSYCQFAEWHCSFTWATLGSACEVFSWPMKYEGIFQTLSFKKRVIFLLEGKVHGGSLFTAGMTWWLVQLAHLDTTKFSLEKGSENKLTKMQWKKHLSNEVYVVWIISTHSDYLKCSLKQKVMHLGPQPNKIIREESIKWSLADSIKNIM